MERQDGSGEPIGILLHAGTLHALDRGKERTAEIGSPSACSLGWWRVENGLRVDLSLDTIELFFRCRRGREW